MSDRNRLTDWNFRGMAATAAVFVGVLVATTPAAGQSASAAPPIPATTGAPTFAKDIAPILQRSCLNCHTPEGVAPMSLVTYEEVRPWVRSIKRRTGMGPRAGVMPPWFVEKEIGIQKFKGDPSLSEKEIAQIAAWADAGAPLGNVADMPAAKAKTTTLTWNIGEPDLVLRSKEMVVPATGPDWWGDVGHVPTGLTEDRYVSAVEVRELNDIPRSGPTSTVGGRYVFHHMTYESEVVGGSDEANTSWPIHEVGRNADIFPPQAGRLLAAGSSLALTAGHIHSNGRETKAQLEFGFKFFPKGYQPLYKRSPLRLGNGIDLDVKSNQAKQEIHSYGVLQEHTKIIAFEPHLHAPGVRMCIEAVWGHNILTLNCVGYDHHWVKQYVYEDDSAPLLPKGTIVHLIGFLDTTSANTNVADARNWAGGGRRSVANMFIDLGYSVSLTEEQFQAEMATRRAKMKNRNEYDIGCPLCWATPPPTTAAPAGAVGGRQPQ